MRKLPVPSRSSKPSKRVPTLRGSKAAVTPGESRTVPRSAKPFGVAESGPVGAPRRTGGGNGHSDNPHGPLHPGDYGVHSHPDAGGPVHSGPDREP